MEKAKGVIGFQAVGIENLTAFFVLMREVKGICFSKKLKNIEILDYKKRHDF